MSARLFWIVFWLMVATAAAVILITELRYPPQLPVVEAVAPPSPEEIPPLQPFELPAEIRYQKVVTRPLFMADRRPEEEVKEEEPPPPPVPPEVEQEVDLIGVVMIAGKTSILLKTRGPEAKVLRIRQGEEQEGWQLQSATAKKAVLLREGKTREVELLRPPVTVLPLPDPIATPPKTPTSAQNANQRRNAARARSRDTANQRDRANRYRRADRPQRTPRPRNPSRLGDRTPPKASFR